MTSTDPTPILQVNDLRTSFFTDAGELRAVDGLTFHLLPGETLGIVGESGSGKSVAALSLLRLLPMPPGKIVGGQALFRSDPNRPAFTEDLLNLPAARLRQIRGNDIAMIFQEPMTSLNPLMKIGRQITEALQLHKGLSSNQARVRAAELLEMVGIPASHDRLNDYPHQFSGGMRQRVMIAMALSCDPQILLADEPTTALDVTIQAQVLELLARVTGTDASAEQASARNGTADIVTPTARTDTSIAGTTGAQSTKKTSVILITHNLGVIARYADRVLVMYAGRAVEIGPASAIYHRPHHAYTLGLLQSVPRLDAERERGAGTRAPEPHIIPIDGSPPDPIHLPPGCAFAPRCRFATDICHEVRPALQDVGTGHDDAGHQAACHHADQVLAAATEAAPATT